MKNTRFFSAFAALILGTASCSALPAYAEDAEVLYGDIRYAQALNTELGIYAGDTLDCSKVILEAVQYDWEGKASYAYSFTVGSGEYAELYTLDTSGVDTETPGDYEVIIRPAAGATGSFPDRFVSPVRYYDLCLKGTESAIPVKIYDKDYNSDTPLYLRCYPEFIEMYCGEGVMVPLVGAYPANVEYEIADETIARVEKSSTPQNLLLWGLKEGETTVTVRTSDGRTTTEKVRVLPAPTTDVTELTVTTTTLSGETTKTTTTTITTVDPATTTTKWWYKYEPTTTEQTTTAIFTEATSTTTVNHVSGTAPIISSSDVSGTKITDEVLDDATLGDANCDHDVDVSDAVLVARYVAEDSSAEMSAQGKINADVNENGEITSDDVILILQKIAKII